SPRIILLFRGKSTPAMRGMLSPKKILALALFVFRSAFAHHEYLSAAADHFTISANRLYRSSHFQVHILLILVRSGILATLPSKLNTSTGDLPGFLPLTTL